MENNHYDKTEIEKQMDSKSDSNHTHDYLPNTGGKLNGRLDLGHNDLVFMDEDSGDIVFLNEDGTIEKARIFTGGDKENPTLNISLYNRSCNFILEKDKLKINGFGDAPIFINDKERLLTDKYTYGQYGTTLRNVDLDTLLVGRYSCFGCPNSPNFNLTQDNHFLLDVFRHDDLWLTQVAYDVRSNNIYVRSKTSDIWGTWDKFVLSSNLYLHNKVEIELLEMELGLTTNNKIKTLNLNLETEEEKPPFDNPFKTKWWKIYKELRVKEHIQRLYNLNLITKDDYIKIVGEEPKEKYKPNNIFTRLRQDILNQDLQLLEQDLRLISIENTFNKDINTFINKDINTFNISELNNNSYNLLLRIIQNKNYKDKSEIINIIEFYHGNNKIYDDNKNNLIKLINSK